MPMSVDCSKTAQEILLEVVQKRVKICKGCEYNEGGVCIKEEEVHPGRATISHGVLKPYHRCREGKWGPIPSKCRTCPRENQIVSADTQQCRMCLHRERIYKKSLPDHEKKEQDPLVTHCCTKCKRHLSGYKECKYCNRRIELEERVQEIRKLRTNPSSSSFTVVDHKEIRFVKEEDFVRDTLNLIGIIPPDITAIVGVARSGVDPACRLAKYMHCSLFILRQSEGDIIYAGHGHRIHKGDTWQQRALLVDDTVFTGTSFSHTVPIMKKYFKDFKTAAVYVNPRASYKPDYYTVKLGWPHLLEWNLFNSILSRNSATDFDGILCHDCSWGEDDDGPKYLNFIRTARPKYPIRITTIPLIITARIEKYRAETIEWLKRHRINYRQLIMHPASTLEERRRDDIAAWKAKHYLNWHNHHRPQPAPNLFIESDLKQAERIAKLTGKLVVCPSTRKVFS